MVAARILIGTSGWHYKRTADFVYVYVRGHGPGGRYRGHYSRATLMQWARRIRSWKR
jgi:uncharacterized protein YecE (DUF72 family)